MYQYCFTLGVVQQAAGELVDCDVKTLVQLIKMTLGCFQPALSIDGAVFDQFTDVHMRVNELEIMK